MPNSLVLAKKSPATNPREIKSHIGGQFCWSETRILRGDDSGWAERGSFSVVVAARLTLGQMFGRINDLSHR